MPIYQINLWICEVCSKQFVVATEVWPYSDPTVVPPDGIEWSYVGELPDEKLACPECLKKESE